MTRDPARIAPILDALGRYWREYPDMRLGQIVVCATGVVGPSPVFNAEDDRPAAWLAEHAPADTKELDVMTDTLDTLLSDFDRRNGNTTLGCWSPTERLARIVRDRLAAIEARIGTPVVESDGYKKITRRLTGPRDGLGRPIEESDEAAKAQDAIDRLTAERDEAREQRDALDRAFDRTLAEVSTARDDLARRLEASVEGHRWTSRLLSEAMAVVADYAKPGDTVAMAIRRLVAEHAACGPVLTAKILAAALDSAGEDLPETSIAAIMAALGTVAVPRG